MRAFPKPHKHKSSGQARLKHKGRHYYLGPWGSPEAAAEYERLKTLLSSATSGILPADTQGELAVALLVSAFLAHAEQYYRDADGGESRELHDFRRSLGWLTRLYARTPARDFGPRDLKAVRQALVDTGRMCRVTINQHVGRIRRCFRWASEDELIPASVYGGLRAVRDLQLGRTPAPDYPDVAPVPRADVEATLPKLGPRTRAMVELLLLTGARPGEICVLRPCDVDRGATPWTFRPYRHKNGWRGQKREILLGPAAQKLLAPLLAKTEPKAWVFPTGLTGRLAGKRYNAASLGHAVRKAALAAGVAPWSPNRIRHLVGTEVRRDHGPEAAQVILGHKHLSTTEIYAERDREKGAAVIKKIG